MTTHNPAKLVAAKESVQDRASIESSDNESIPSFTAPATILWKMIPAETRKLILTSVKCGKCRDEVTITNFSGVVKAGDLLLVGKCSVCYGDVAKLVRQS